MKTKKLINLLILIAVIASIGGCNVGPDYHRPAIDASGQWSEQLAAGQTSGRADIATWWRRFDDAELDALVARAIRSNPDLKIAAARVREARAQQGVAAADLWPNVDASASYARQRESKHQPIIGQLPVPPGTRFENDVYQAGFDSSWELDVFGGTRRAIEAAAANVAAAEFDRQDAQVTLVAEVARNYVGVRNLQRRLEIARENIEAQRSSVALARDRFRNGVVSNLDAEQGATLLAETQAQVPALETQRETSIHRIEVLLGQRPGSLRGELTAAPSVPGASPIPAAAAVVPVGLPSDLLRRRPDIRAAERELAAANANIGVATAELFPKFSLTGAFGWDSVSAADWFSAGSRSFSVGPTIQWRVFDAGRIRFNIEAQNARQQQALGRYEKAVLSGFEDVENALAVYAQEQVRNQSLREGVTAAGNSLRIARQQYAQGLTTFINVLDAERSLYQVQDDLVQSDQAVAQDLIALYKALGGGWSQPDAKRAPRDPIASLDKKRHELPTIGLRQ